MSKTQSSQSITSLSILKANWDVQGKDYVEIFVPIVAECVRLQPHEVISSPVLQEDLQIRFGLLLPQRVLEMILRRARRRGLIRLEDGVFYRNKDALDLLGFHNIQQDVVRKFEALLDALIKYCEKTFSVKWNVENAEAALITYLRENQVSIINASLHGTLLPEPSSTEPTSRFLMGAFVNHLQATFASEFEYLIQIVTGNMLANAVFLPNPYEANRRFRDTEVYFDTAFLIFALGYSGKTRSAPTHELLELLYETGANLRCFSHTVEEIRGVLNACANQLALGGLRRAWGPIIPSVEFFLSTGLSASDVELLAVQLPKTIESLRIKVVDKPPYVVKLVIDEKLLGEKLSEEITYTNPQALDRDVDSISAIYRLRRGNQYYSIEDCRAIFVTTNSSLARCASKFFYQDAPPSAISPCVTDYTLTNLIWLKRPMDAPDLPRKRIVADFFAAVQPSDRLLRKYVSEIRKLSQSGNISEDDVYLLRYSLEAKKSLMEATLGEESAFTEGTVPEILETVQNKIRSDLEMELEAQNLALEQSRLREVNRRSTISLRALAISKIIVTILEVCFCQSKMDPLGNRK